MPSTAAGQNVSQSSSSGTFATAGRAVTTGAAAGDTGAADEGTDDGTDEGADEGAADDRAGEAGDPRTVRAVAAVSGRDAAGSTVPGADVPAAAFAGVDVPAADAGAFAPGSDTVPADPDAFTGGGAFGAAEASADAGAFAGAEAVAGTGAPAAITVFWKDGSSTGRSRSAARAGSDDSACVRPGRASSSAGMPSAHGERARAPPSTRNTDTASVSARACSFRLSAAAALSSTSAAFCCVIWSSWPIAAPTCPI